MHNTKETNPITAAKEKLEDTLRYFIDGTNAFDASTGMLTLLKEMRPDDLLPEEAKAIYGMLQVVNAVSRLQVAESHEAFTPNHKLKIA
jgi:hypothetical protein